MLCVGLRRERLASCQEDYSMKQAAECHEVDKVKYKAIGAMERGQRVHPQLLLFSS